MVLKIKNSFVLDYRLYQIRVGLRVSPKVPVHIEASVSSSNGGARTSRPSAYASLIGGLAASRPFQIMYRNEEVTLRDIVHFRAHLLGNYLLLPFDGIYFSTGRPRFLSVCPFYPAKQCRYVPV